MIINCSILPQDVYKVLPWKLVGAWELQHILRMAGQKNVKVLLFSLVKSYSNSFSSTDASAHKCEWA